MLVRRDRKRATEKGGKINHNQIIRERRERRVRKNSFERLGKLEVGRQICLHLLSTLATSLVAIINNCFHPSVSGNGKNHNLTFPF